MKEEFKAKVCLKSGLIVEAEAREFKVSMDEPETLGGTNTAMNPVELLLCSLGGCLSIVVAAFSKAVNVDIEDCNVEICGDLDPDGFQGKNKDARVGFSQIRYKINLKSNSPKENIDKLMKLVEERCPVSDTLKGVEVVGDLNLNN